MYIDILRSSSQSRCEKAAEADRDKVKVLEAQMREHMDHTKIEQHELSERERNLKDKTSNEIPDDDERNVVLEEIEKQAGFLAANQRSCQALYDKVRCILVDQEIGRVTTSRGSVAKVGVSKDIVGDIRQRVGDVTTDLNSTSIVGIW